VDTEYGRAYTRTASTPSRFTADLNTQTSHQRSPSSARSMCLVWIKGRARSVIAQEHMLHDIDGIQVDLSKLPSIAAWKRDFTMETILIELRRFMAAPANKKLPQPAEGTNF
jgi:hypothetical protein